MLYKRSEVKIGGFSLMDLIVTIIHFSDPADRGTLCPQPHALGYINIYRSKTPNSSLQIFFHVASEG